VSRKKSYYSSIVVPGTAKIDGKRHFQIFKVVGKGIFPLRIPSYIQMLDLLVAIAFEQYISSVDLDLDSQS